MRNNGLPFSIRNWMVEVASRASTEQTKVWIRVKGLNSLSYAGEAEVKDGSGAADGWKEPYVTKRGGTIKLTGRQVGDPQTGALDPGQSELDFQATVVGFDGDTQLRLTDPYGHAMLLDVIVTDAGREADEGGELKSWTLELVGEPVELSYIQLTSLALLVNGQEQTEVCIDVNQTQPVAVRLVPGDASNQKFSVASADAGRVNVAQVDGLAFNIIGQQPTDAPVRVVVRSMNNAIERVLKVTVR